MTSGCGAGWADNAACTLPSPERPLRTAAFTDLFSSSLRAVDRRDRTRARLVLLGGADLVDRVRELTLAETACCSFFRFHVASRAGGVVLLDVAVPVAHAEVLDGLAADAEAVLDARTHRATDHA